MLTQPAIKALFVLKKEGHKQAQLDGVVFDLSDEQLDDNFKKSFDNLEKALQKRKTTKKNTTNPPNITQELPRNQFLELENRALSDNEIFTEFSMHIPDFVDCGVLQTDLRVYVGGIDDFDITKLEIYVKAWSSKYDSWINSKDSVKKAFLFFRLFQIVTFAEMEENVERLYGWRGFLPQTLQSNKGFRQWKSRSRSVYWFLRYQGPKYLVGIKKKGQGKLTLGQIQDDVGLRRILSSTVLLGATSGSGLLYIYIYINSLYI
jgi:hypothetical protein